MKRCFLGIIMGVMMLGGAAATAMPAEAAATPMTTFADVVDCPSNTFLGFKPWFAGLKCEGNAPIIDKRNDMDGAVQNLGGFVWRIVLNIIFDISLAIGYVATAMVIYGGYMYIMSSGDPGKAAKGQKTLTTATIGTVIAMGASVIVRAIMAVLGINEASGAQQQSFSINEVKGAFNWAYGIASLVAVIYIVKSGITMMVAVGDPGKVQKARKALAYALIGLAIALLASVITNLVIGRIGDALAIAPITMGVLV